MTFIDVFKIIFMAVYATGVTLGTFFFFYCLVFGTIPEENQQYANLILGFLIGSGMSTFLGYYFGTSQSTKGRPVMDPLPTNGTHTQTITETTESKTTDKGE